ncbi:YybH family protein [Peterkaempfera bronchialis]|uniref:YybH family protein n=1 Tax=Peterkaempfera bronchialis TaxID=2126346 RepID=UPI003C2D2631
MTSRTTPETTAEAAVRQAADALVAAFAANRVDDYFAAFAPDATFVFHTTARRLASTAEYRALWQTWVEQDDFRVLACASTSPLVQLLGDTAVFSHRVETRIGTRAGEETVHERETIVFHRTADNRWLAVHEHLSPAPPQD